MKIKDLIEQLQTYNPETKVTAAYWTADDFMDWHDIPAEHKHLVEDALDNIDAYDWSIINDCLYGAYENALKCSQETPPVYELGWEESPK